MLTSCRSIGRIIEHETERKISEITEAQVEAIVSRKISEVFTDHLPEGLLGVLCSALGLKLMTRRKNGINNGGSNNA